MALLIAGKTKYKIWVETVRRTPAQIARTWAHELQHFKDFTNLPGITHLAARKNYFPGSGLARYFLEIRGYKAGGTLKGLKTPLQSFKPHHIEWLEYDLAIFEGLGAAGTAELLHFWLTGDE